MQAHVNERKRIWEKGINEQDGERFGRRHTEKLGQRKRTDN